MLTRRIIPCLDMSGGRVVKGVRFRELRDMGAPEALARTYESQGADELVLLDVAATPQGRGALLDVVARVADAIFIPFTVGGGIRSEQDARDLFAHGADKVSLNSAAVDDPELITRLAARYGSQAVVVAIDARRRPPAIAGSGRVGWEVLVRGARQETGLDAVAWAREAERRGAGEILLTSIDRDGTNEGYDLELVRAVAAAVGIPVIASGGAGSPAHFADVLAAGASAALAASLFHTGALSIGDVKACVARAGLPVRGLPAPEAIGAAVPEADEATRLFLDGLRFDDDGLVTVVAQSAEDDAVLMVAHANREAVRRTLAEGRAWYFSRSRGRLWRKGETSGHLQDVVAVERDCDGDALVYRVLPRGPACHTGLPRCFDSGRVIWRFTGRSADASPPSMGILDDLYAMAASRPRDADAASYTSRLLAAGPVAIARKAVEEACEVADATAAGDEEAIVQEIADLAYHLAVLLAALGISPSTIERELRRRRDPRWDANRRSTTRPEAKRRPSGPGAGDLALPRPEGAW